MSSGRDQIVTGRSGAGAPSGHSDKPEPISVVSAAGAASTPNAAQELFDRAVLALVIQGEPAFVGARCLYRTTLGLKCAVGHLIPDDRYDPSFEGRPADSTTILDAIGAEDSLGSMLEDIQDAHDNPAGDLTGEAWLSEFLIRARTVARRYNLSTAVIDQSSAASAIEARSDATAQTGAAVGESATAESRDAHPNPGQSS